MKISIFKQTKGNKPLSLSLCWRERERERTKKESISANVFEHVWMSIQSLWFDYYYVIPM